jgi:predicted DsbA family dithiol-disulfide isomerase
MTRIELYADFVCPWCFIGSERLDRVASDAQVEHRAFMLDSSTPHEGVVIADMLRKKYGADPQRMFATVEGAARSSGIDLDLSKQTRMYPTVRAHALAMSASGETQRALVRDLFRAYFVDAKNIDDLEVLADIATRHGLSNDAASDPRALRDVDAAARASLERGIRGVPFFVFGDRFAVSGAQSEDVLRATLEKAAKT